MALVKISISNALAHQRNKTLPLGGNPRFGAWHDAGLIPRLHPIVDRKRAVFIQTEFHHLAFDAFHRFVFQHERHKLNGGDIAVASFTFTNTFKLMLGVSVPTMQPPSVARIPRHKNNSKIKVKIWLANFHCVTQSRVMPKKKPVKKMLSNAQLRDKIRAGNDFVVASISERKRALMVASVLNIEIITRESDGGGFRIFIPSDVPN